MTRTAPTEPATPDYTRSIIRFVFVVAVAIIGGHLIAWLVAHPVVVLIGVVIAAVFTVIYLLNAFLDHLADEHHTAALYRRAAHYEARQAATRAREETP